MSSLALNNLQAGGVLQVLRLSKNVWMSSAVESLHILKLDSLYEDMNFISRAALSPFHLSKMVRRYTACGITWRNYGWHISHTIHLSDNQWLQKDVWRAVVPWRVFWEMYLCSGGGFWADQIPEGLEIHHRYKCLRKTHPNSVVGIVVMMGSCPCVPVQV